LSVTIILSTFLLTFRKEQHIYEYILIYKNEEKVKRHKDTCDCRIIHDEKVKEARLRALDDLATEDLCQTFKALGDVSRLKILWALEHQDELQTLYTGGTVFHAFIGERIDDWRQARLLVRRIAERYHLPYFTLTPTFSVCPSHGYLNGEHARCSICDAETEVYSRVVGYLRPVKQWNYGKQAEFGLRKTFKVA